MPAQETLIQRENAAKQEEQQQKDGKTVPAAATTAGGKPPPHHCQQTPHYKRRTRCKPEALLFAGGSGVRKLWHRSMRAAGWCPLHLPAPLAPGICLALFAPFGAAWRPCFCAPRIDHAPTGREPSLSLPPNTALTFTSEKCHQPTAAASTHEARYVSSLHSRVSSPQKLFFFFNRCEARPHREAPVHCG